MSKERERLLLGTVGDGDRRVISGKVEHMSTAQLLSPNVNVRLESRLLVLEPITASRMDETYIGWLNDPETNQFLETRYEQQTLANAEAYVNRLRGIPGCECFSVTQKKGQRPVGTTSITAYNSRGHGMAVYGIMIGDPGACMIGIGGMVHAMLLEFLFSDSRIRRIQEGAYAALRVGDRIVGAPTRATSFPSNVWEYPVPRRDSHYTYFVPVTDDMVGQPVEVIVLGMDPEHLAFEPEVWLTAYATPHASQELVLGVN